MAPTPSRNTEPPVTLARNVGMRISDRSMMGLETLREYGT